MLLLFDAPMRRQLRRPGPWLGVAIAAFVFLPVVLWNVNNHFESFRFQTAHRFEVGGGLGVRHPLGFLLEQFGMLHPAVALALPLALLWLLRGSPRDARSLWLVAFGLPLPVYVFANSLWMSTKANWLAPAVVPLLLGVVVWWRESGVAVRWPRAVRVAGALLLATIAVLPFAPLIRLVPQHSGTSWTGWDQIATCAEAWEERLDVEDGVEGNVFFFAADYRDAAQLTRNLELLPPEPAARDGHGHWLEPTLAQNVFGRAALQFDHWEDPAAHVGNDAVFVLPRPDRREDVLADVRRHFRSVQPVDRVLVRRLGIPVLEAAIFVCRSYRGPHAG